MVRQPKKILIADDEVNIRLLVSSMLEGDYIVLGASDGEEAINMARCQSPDLILMDIMMPKLDGYSACHAIKNDRLTNKIPVVMVTALGPELNRKFAERVGADAYLVKPFSLESLRGTVARLLESNPEITTSGGVAEPS